MITSPIDNHIDDMDGSELRTVGPSTDDGFKVSGYNENLILHLFYRLISKMTHKI